MKKIKNLVYEGVQHFLETKYKIFFCFNKKKIFLHPLVEIIFRYHKFSLGFWDPLGPPYEQNENFCMWDHGYQNSVKRVRWVHFWRNFEKKKKKNEGFGPKFWDTQYKFFLLWSKSPYYKAFSGIASWMKMLSEYWRVEHVNIYVCIYVFI